MGVLAMTLGLLYVKNGEARKEIVINKERKNALHKERYADFVKATKKSSLYKKTNKKFVKVGEVNEGSILSLDSEDDYQDDYYRLKNSEYYISYDYVKPSEEKVVDDAYKRYIPFNENVITKTGANLYDESGYLKYTLEESLDTPIYMKKDGKTFFEFEDALYSVNQNDVESIKKSHNTDIANATRVPVFMYHFFYDEQAHEVAGDGNFTEIHNFRNQIMKAKEIGFESVRMKDLNLYLDGSIQLAPKSFVITMDDNAESVKRLAYPVLEETKTYATNFAITSWTQDYTPLKSNYVELQSHSDAMHQGGCKGMKHGGKFMCIDYNGGVQDLKTSTDKIGANVLCYPFGDYNDAAKKMVKDAGYVMGFTVENGYVSIGMDKYQLPRVRISTRVTPEKFARLLEG